MPLLPGSLSAAIQAQLAGARLHDVALEVPLAVLVSLLVARLEATLARS